jgi:nucleoside-diphosphate-sugar epimerase
MPTYLLTGVAGFIASATARRLLADGHQVVGVDNLNDAYDVRLKHWRLAQLDRTPGFSFHIADISTRGALDPLFAAQRFDAVINLAARAGVRASVANPWVYIDTNVTGTLNLLELCRAHGTPKFVLASTSSLYGQDNPMPYLEEGCRSALPYLPLSLRPGRDRRALFYRVRPGRAPGYEPVPFRAGDLRGACDHGLRRRHAVT